MYMQIHVHVPLHFLYVLLGSVVGQGLTDHLDVRKVGFTGSTDVGKGIMQRHV